MTDFLVDASLPRAVGDAIRSAGHRAVDVRDIRLGAASDAAIASYAREGGFCLITRDEDFTNILDYPPGLYGGIVVVRGPRGAGRQLMLNLTSAFLANGEVMRALTGRLVIVEPGRIRVRPT